MEFTAFKTAVAQQFSRMAEFPLLRTNADKDVLWATYLDAFPAGTNEVYKKRREYDCSCCKQFIRAVGDIVAIIDGKIVSLWDCEINDATFSPVAAAMSRAVTATPISDAFLHYDKVAGTDKSLVQMLEGVHTWRHFFVNLPTKFVKRKTDIAPALAEVRDTHDVLARGLDTISDESITTVLDLIAQNSLYRGDEHKAAVSNFQALKHKYATARADGRDVFVWERLQSLPGHVARLRNTVIGTLLVDLSEGVEIERAVSSYESKVAPANYKRPKALVTPAMIAKAKDAVSELGLTSALERRFATIDDITVNNILFANRNARRIMRADVFDSIASQVPIKASAKKTDDVSIDVFLADILPRIDSLEVMVENRHAPNFMSLIAPADPTAKPLFKWGNQFSWSYAGDVADSIRERVKKAGGNVSGDLCCRLAWYNHDDLDLHMVEADRHEIYFGNARRTSACGGVLDVDMNAGRGTTRSPVENIFYANKSTMKEGEYTLFVHNYCNRDTKDVGFEVEIDWLGNVQRFAYAQAVANNARIGVARFRYSRAKGLEVIESLPSSTVSREVWGVQTQAFQPVNVLMRSPNHWDTQAVGNKHWFFMLENCRNDGTARGFYNEFLTDELTAHRKVIELVGSKMRTEKSDKQLSGLGFSSTQRNSVLCRVKGDFNRTINLTF